MKNITNMILVLALGLLAVGCSSKQVRNKWTDKNMRIMIDPDSLASTDYVAVQTALVKDSSFTVVDRKAGFKAIKTEQERNHRTENDRYMDREKWSHWGKLYGVGAVVVGHKQCYNAKPFFSRHQVVNRCKQFLSIVDSNTGEVLAVSEAENDTPAYQEYGSFQQPADWSDAVERLVEAYPKEFKPTYYSDGLRNYQDLSEEEAKRQKDLAANGQ